MPQNNLIFFFDRITKLIDEGSALDIVYLGFSQTLDKVPKTVLVAKMEKYCLDRFRIVG